MHELPALRASCPPLPGFNSRLCMNVPSGIFASGNVVHNLRLLDWDNPDSAAPWAEDFDSQIKNFILAGEFDKVVNYRDLGHGAKMAVPTPDHFYPLLYALGAANRKDKVKVFNEARIMGSLSMTSYIFG